MSGSDLSESSSPSLAAMEGPRPSDDRLPLLWPGLRHALGTVFVVIAVLLLQVVLAAFYWIADPTWSQVLAPTWETPAIALVLIGAAALGRGRRRGWGERALVIGMTLLVFAYFLVGLGQGFALREFGYDVVLRLHIAYVPEIFRMMYGAEPLGWFIFYVALLAIGVFAIVAAIYASVRHIEGFARVSRRRRIGLAAGVLAACGLGAALLGGMNGPITREAYVQLDLALNLDERLDTTARRLEMDAEQLGHGSPFSRPGAERPTILLFVVESYGEVLFRDPDFSSFPAWLEKQGAALGQAGYHIASKQMVSPVFGGSSWLAGTSLLCGVSISDQKRFQAALGSDVRCLPALLNEAGYQTVIAAANQKYREESYTRTLPFEQYYIRDDFGYRGPRMGWSFMPDQYVIDFIHRRVIAPRLVAGGKPEPLFMAYFLTTSHHPWAVIPAFVEDWSTIGDGAIYAELPATEFRNQFVAGNDYKPAYRASVEYSLHTIASYLATLPADDRSVIIVLGDHQPRRPVARMKGDPWTVPVHVLSRDPSVIERFKRVGYRPGLQPAQEQAPTGFEHFMLELFAAYGRGP